jgi:dimeric dUTPase (all-alpha-NTP-PPase superfamily)
MSSLQMILDNQRKLQLKSYGVDVSTLDGEERAAYIRNMSLALTDELHEALNETGWKPWATSRHLNRAAFAGEMIDVLHFWVNLIQFFVYFCLKMQGLAARFMNQTVLPLSNCPAHSIFTPNSSAAFIAHLGFLIMALARNTASA